MAHRTRRELDGRFTAVLERQDSVRQPHSILFIEPDDSRDMYAYYLRESGFTVQTADTTDDGLIRTSDADVIVTGICVISASSRISSAASEKIAPPPT